MSFPVFDLHCDTALALLGRDLSGQGSLRSNALHIDLTRASALAGYAQCFACFTYPSKHLPAGVTAEDWFCRELAAIQREVAANADLITMAKNAAQVEENRKQGRMSAILTIEGTAGIGFDPARLEQLYETGFRMTTLTWNEQNVLAGSHVTGGGLTDLGKEYVREAQRLGMIVDVSHISDEAFWDILKITQGPIVASHSNSRTVHPVSRNLTDDMFRAICGTGGTAGINQYASFLGEKPDLSTVAAHVLHLLEIDPDCKHISLGGDLDGCDEFCEGFTGIESYPAMARALEHHGLDREMIYRLYWSNALGVMERCCT